MGYCGTMGVDGVREDVMERLRGVCEGLGMEVIPSSRFFAKPILLTSKKVYVFSYATSDNIETLIKNISTKVAKPLPIANM